VTRLASELHQDDAQMPIGIFAIASEIFGARDLLRSAGGGRGAFIRTIFSQARKKGRRHGDSVDSGAPQLFAELAQSRVSWGAAT
jgi:hypothetical protein